MIGAPNTRGQKYWVGIVQWAPETLVSEAVSEAYPTTELAACGGRVIYPKHQIVYLAHVTRCRRCSEMRLSGAEPGSKQRRADHTKYIWYVATHGQSVITTELMIA